MEMINSVPHGPVIDDHGQQHPQNVVGEGGQHRPDHGPGQSMEKGMGLDGVAQKNIRYVGQPRPRE